MGRLYNFSSVYNFRDFGDYDTQSGQPVKPNRLYRSAHLNAVNDVDLAAIANMNIGLVVDLRYHPERKRQPNKLPQAKLPLVIEYPDAIGTEKAEYAPHEMFIREDLRHADDARNYMQRSYAARPNDPGFRKVFSDTLKFMARTGEPVLIHCAAGKDRTGTLAAIILSSLGVEQETIMEDFMLTMKAVDVDSFLEPAAARMTERFGRPYAPEALRPMFGVEAGYLSAALETIDNMDHYIENVLGITRAERDALARHYLTD